MALPNPLPDNPTRWDGWRNYNSEDLYARLCLSFDTNPTAEQIEDSCRQLLVWWQKKLPLKNQPSNPVAQMLRAGLDEAPHFLAEARTKLLDPELRAALDTELRAKIVTGALEEFRKLFPFAIANGYLSADSEQRLVEAGSTLGLLQAELEEAIATELERVGAVRGERPQAVSEASPSNAAPAQPHYAPAAAPADPFDEFRRVLRLSRLCLEGDDMTDDQRDALCNMGESLGLTGGQAEDLIDEYLEEMSSSPMAPAAKPIQMSSQGVTLRGAVVTAPVRPGTSVAPQRGNPAISATRHAASLPAPPRREPAVIVSKINTSPVARVLERSKYQDFRNSVNCEMMLIPSGEFLMGSDAPDAASHEQPVLKTVVGCFFMARFPITNAQYEVFDPAHQNRRAPWADHRHPAVYVNSIDATAFCQWLSAKEGRKYRLPTEAEWEYAARGTDDRVFPWGERLDAGFYANFADKRTTFAWRDPNIDDGWAETAPVGSYPRGTSPFGIEEMSGNVFEWCLDFFDLYRTRLRVNPRGPMTGLKRIYRGGSWKSRAGSTRASARAFNAPDYSSNDVGFRIICECEG